MLLGIFMAEWSAVGLIANSVFLTVLYFAAPIVFIIGFGMSFIKDEKNGDDNKKDKN